MRRLRPGADCKEIPYESIQIISILNALGQAHPHRLEVLMTRDEIRLRALRAAAAVSLTAGLFGCAATIEVEPASNDDEGDETSSEEGSTSASNAGETPVEPDAGPEDAATPMDATADAQVNCTQATDMAACCEAQSWSPEAGCMAWGPPMPPAMEVA
jgi:hypothetical protein